MPWGYKDERTSFCHCGVHRLAGTQTYMIQFDKCHDCDKNYRAQKLTSKELEEGYGLASCSRIELICKLLEICRKCQPAFGMGKDILDKETARSKSWQHKKHNVFQYLLVDWQCPGIDVGMERVQRGNDRRYWVRRWGNLFTVPKSLYFILKQVGASKVF